MVQRNIFAYTFEPSANDAQIHGCPLSLHQDVNAVQMWHLPSLLWIANLVQYQSLLLRKFVQMWYLLHICCNLATLVNPFFHPVLDKSTSCKSKSNIPPVFNAHAPTITLYMSYTSFFIHQPQLSLLKSSQPFLFYSIRRLRDCHRRLRTFLHLVHRQFTSLGTMDGEHS